MGSAMMRPTTQAASMMVEIAVLTPTPITALSAFVTIQKIVPLGLPPLLLDYKTRNDERGALKETDR